MIQVIRDYLPTGSRNRPGIPMKAEWVTVHDTGNTQTRATALAHAGYLRRAGRTVPASWHFTVDDRCIVQHLPVCEVAYHAGDGAAGPGNLTSIGIEICENSGGDRERAEANAIRLIAWLLSQAGLGADRVVPHKRWNGNNCPHILLPRWEEFTARVARALGSLPPQPPHHGFPREGARFGDVALEDYLRVVAERDALAQKLERIRAIAAM